MKFLKDSDFRFQAMAKYNLCKYMSDETYIRRMFKARLGYNVSLDNPKTFNEKLQWLKLHDRQLIYSDMVDKYEAKKYIGNIIGEEYIIPTYAVWERYEDIDFEALPNKFVLKCTHDSGGLVICENKKSFEKEKARKKITSSLKRNYFYNSREWPYKNVRPRIIAEKYMLDTNLKELRDYKIFCFNGKAKFFKVDFDRFTDHHANYYDVNTLRLLPFGETKCPPVVDRVIDIPDTLPKMIELAEKISSEFSFLRIDFYSVDSEIYFGEVTFFPASGFGRFVPEEWDRKIGEMLHLPIEYKGDDDNE